MTKIIKLLMVLLCYQGFSQNVPVNQYDTSKQYSTFREHLSKNFQDRAVGLNYYVPTFLNGVYGEQAQNGDINFQYGASLTIRWVFAKQILVDADFFYSVFKSGESNFGYYGGDVSMGVILIPFTLKLTSVLQPYASLGYQFSLIGLESSNNSAITEDLKGKSTDTSAPIWKGGLMIHVSKSIYFNGEYKQSFSSSKNRDFNSWSAGIGYKF